jgi:hypothetical protein
MLILDIIGGLPIAPSVFLANQINLLHLKEI